MFSKLLKLKFIKLILYHSVVVAACITVKSFILNCNLDDDEFSVYYNEIVDALIPLLDCLIPARVTMAIYMLLGVIRNKFEILYKF